jgi:hypothetical protein
MMDAVKSDDAASLWQACIGLAVEGLVPDDCMARKVPGALLDFPTRAGG